jgi:hypothetical protein
MSTLLDISVFGLSGLLALEYMVFTAVMRETDRLVARYGAGPPARRANRPQLQVTKLRSGERIPRFRGRLLDSRIVVTRRDISNETTALLFLSSEAMNDTSHDSFNAMVHALSHKANEHLYVIWSGPLEDCRRFKEQHLVTRNHCARAQVIVDENRRIRNSFAIVSAAPAALLVNEKGYILKIGQLSPESSMSTALP